MVNPLYILVSLVFFALLIFFVQRFSKYFALLATAFNFYLSINILIAALKKPLLVNLGGWKVPFCISLFASPLSAALVLLVSLVGFCAVVFSFSYIEEEKNRYYALLLLLLAGSSGVVLAADIFNMFVFFEILCISSYALVAYQRKADSFEAAFKYLVQGSVGSSFILIAIAIIYGLFGTLNLAHIARHISFPLTFSLKVALALLVAGFGVEAAIFPFNFWLPDAHPAAPSPVSAVLSGLAIKVGLYAVLRLIFTIFGYPGVFLPLLFLALFTFVIGEFAALAQGNLKRMLAYSSMGQIGLIAAVMSFGSVYTFTAGFLQIFNHALAKSVLFLASGVFFYQGHSLEISDLKGAGRKNVLVGAAFAAGIFSLVGLPPFLGFFSKLAILVSLFRTQGTLVLAYIFIFLIVILTAVEAAYFLRVLGVLYQKPAVFSAASGGKKMALMQIPVVFLGLLLLGLGLFPQIVQKIAYFAASSLLNKAAYIKFILG